MRIGSLFSGAAGLDMAVEQVFGGHVVWHSEMDKAASKVLAYRYPGVPNLGDVSEINWRAMKKVGGGDANGSHADIDIICGGFP